MLDGHIGAVRQACTLGRGASERHVDGHGFIHTVFGCSVHGHHAAGRRAGLAANVDDEPATLVLHSWSHTLREKHWAQKVHLHQLHPRLRRLGRVALRRLMRVASASRWAHVPRGWNAFSPSESQQPTTPLGHAYPCRHPLWHRNRQVASGTPASSFRGWPCQHSSRGCLPRGRQPARRCINRRRTWRRRGHKDARTPGKSRRCTSTLERRITRHIPHPATRSLYSFKNQVRPIIRPPPAATQHSIHRHAANLIKRTNLLLDTHTDTPLKRQPLDIE
jgi:hypothetical protein